MSGLTLGARNDGASRPHVPTMDGTFGPTAVDLTAPELTTEQLLIVAHVLDRSCVIMLSPLFAVVARHCLLGGKYLTF